MFFDTQNVKAEEGREFAPLPIGWYRVMIEGAIPKDTKKGDGQYVAVTYTVIEGEFKGRKLFDKFNIKNPSAEAERIGKGQFKALLNAVGFKDALQSAEDLGKLQHGMLYVKLKIGKGLDGSPENKIVDRADKPKEERGQAAKPAGAMDQIPF